MRKEKDESKLWKSWNGSQIMRKRSNGDIVDRDQPQKFKCNFLFDSQRSSSSPNPFPNNAFLEPSFLPSF